MQNWQIDELSICHLSYKDFKPSLFICRVISFCEREIISTDYKPKIDFGVSLIKCMSIVFIWHCQLPLYFTFLIVGSNIVATAEDPDSFCASIEASLNCCLNQAFLYFIDIFVKGNNNIEIIKPITCTDSSVKYSGNMSDGITQNCMACSITWMGYKLMMMGHKDCQHQSMLGLSQSYPRQEALEVIVELPKTNMWTFSPIWMKCLILIKDSIKFLFLKTSKILMD